MMEMTCRGWQILAVYERVARGKSHGSTSCKCIYFCYVMAIDLKWGDDGHCVKTES